MTLTATLTWIEHLLAFAMIVQSLELLSLWREFSCQGLWSWANLKPNHMGRVTHSISTKLFSQSGTISILALQLAFALSLLLTPYWQGLVALWLTTVVLRVRFRGPFNGASDTMTLIVVTTLIVARSFDGRPLIATLSLTYLSLQTVLSYFLAGIAKVRHSPWRNGTAPAVFAQGSIYTQSQSLLKALAHPLISKFVAWFILIFECSFPVALLSPNIALIYILAGVFFHLANAYVFGLNRFFWVWLSTYPALYFVSQFPKL